MGHAGEAPSGQGGTDVRVGAALPEERGHTVVGRDSLLELTERVVEWIDRWLCGSGTRAVRAVAEWFDRRL